MAGIQNMDSYIAGVLLSVPVGAGRCISAPLGGAFGVWGCTAPPGTCVFGVPGCTISPFCGKFVGGWLSGGAVTVSGALLAFGAEPSLGSLEGGDIGE
jgi:hypothetical protein